MSLLPRYLSICILFGVGTLSWVTAAKPDNDSHETTPASTSSSEPENSMPVAWKSDAGLHMALLLLESEDADQKAMGKKLFGSLVEKGDPAALVIEAMRSLNTGDKSAAVAYLTTSVEKNFTFAKVTLGDGYLVGDLLPKNEQEGLRLVQDAANDGSVMAYFILGDYYLQKDREKAKRWFSLAAQRDDVLSDDFDPFVSETPLRKSHDSALYRLFSKQAPQLTEIHSISKVAGNLRETFRTAVTDSRVKLADLEKEADSSIKLTAGVGELSENSPVRQAIKRNCLASLDTMLGKGGYEVLEFMVVPVDHEIENVIYAFTVYIIVRRQDPYGYIKRIVTWAAFPDGSLVILSGPPVR